MQPALRSTLRGLIAMSDLTVGLAIVGGVALAAVVAHGAWQARKAGPRRADAGAARRPPRRRRSSRCCDAERRGRGRRRRAAALRRAAPRQPARLDAADRRHRDAARPRRRWPPSSVLAHLPPTRRAGSKPFLIEGLNAETGEWEPIAARRAVRRAAGRRADGQPHAAR